jgi:tRNA (guanine26-N2/guanine27-N2)-dimethyltransferase
MILSEGEIRIELQKEPLTFRGPAKRSKIFYNPAMENNRTLCVLFCDVLRPRDFLDGFAATGVRGMRVMKEASVRAAFNDSEREACRAIDKNLELNGLDADVFNEDFCSLDVSSDFCDVDPFGTPEPYLEKGLELSQRYLAVTATDTAVLFGSNVKKCYERYGAKVRKVSWSKELGARVLCAALAKKAEGSGKGVRPLFVYAEDHYLRGYFEMCDSAPNIGIIDGIGPIWVGELSDRAILVKVLETSGRREYRGKRRIEKLLATAIEEIGSVGCYDLDDVSSKLRRGEPKAQELIESLRSRGFKASRTVFSPKGIKTDASQAELESCFSTSVHNC